MYIYSSDLENWTWVHGQYCKLRALAPVSHLRNALCVMLSYNTTGWELLVRECGAVPAIRLSLCPSLEHPSCESVGGGEPRLCPLLGSGSAPLPAAAAAPFPAPPRAAQQPKHPSRTLLAGTLAAQSVCQNLSFPPSQPTSQVFHLPKHCFSWG